MKKAVVIIAIITVLAIAVAAVLALALGGGSAQMETTGTGAESGGTSASTAPEPPAPEPPAPTDESYFNFEYKSRMSVHDSPRAEWYEISAKSTEDLPEILVIPDEYKGLEVRYIADKGFKESKIKKLVLGKNLTIIGTQAFYGCTELEEVVSLEGGKMAVVSSCFEGCTSLKSAVFHNEEINFNTNNFKDCTALESVIFSAQTSLERIKSGTFRNCKSLKTLVLPSTVTEMDPTAFIGCNELEITFEGNESIENRGNCLIQKESGKLIWCSGKDAIPEDGSVTHIESFYFLEHEGVTEYTVPSVIKSMGKEAFAECKSLTAVTLSENIQAIPEKAFFGLSKLEKIEMPAVYSIGVGAFEACTALREINVSQEFRLFQSFNDCTGLEKAVLEQNIEVMNVAFNNCTALSELVLPKKMWLMTNSFNNCTGIELLELPFFMETLQTSFCGCDGLTEVTVPEGITEVTGSFNACSQLRKVTLPKSVKTIKDSFSGCIKLYDIYFAGTVEEWNKIEKNLEGETTVHCTDGDVKLHE